MKKIGIITLYGNHNYGNKLQNYALQETLIKMGFEVETLRIVSNHNNENFIKLYLRKIYRFFKLYFTIWGKIERKIKKFSDKFLNVSKKEINANCNLTKLADCYDFFVAGSDQVWNYNFFDGNDLLYLLMFSNKEKNISYAASFGINSIDEKYLDLYKKGLNNIKSISVREEVGCDLVNKIIGKHVDVVLDPTMLIESNVWKKLCKKPTNFTNKKYILCFYLTGMNENEYEKLVNYAKNNDLDIINLFNRKYLDYYFYNPQEFLYCIKNAEYVFTDSFHCCVFSILFNKSFYVFEKRKDVKTMISRIDTLLSTFNLMDRKISTICELNKIDESKFKIIDGILSEKKAKYLKFLESSLTCGELYDK